MVVTNLLAGLVLLILGRKLFWLFVGCIGFAAGLSYAGQIWTGQPDWMILVIALGAGLVGALIAIFIQSLAIALSGFLGGGYVAVTLLHLLGLDAPQFYWMIYVIGGLLGAALLIVLFDWGIIVLSSLFGALLIIEASPINPPLQVIVFIILFGIGFAIQARMMQGEPVVRRNH